MFTQHIRILFLLALGGGFYMPHMQAKSFESLFQEGNAAFHSGNTKKAIKRYKQALKTGAHAPQLHFNLAMALSKEDKTTKAIIHFEQAIALNPTYVKAQVQLGIHYEKAGQPDKAIQAYRSALMHDPSCVAAALPLARLLKDRDNFEEAIRLYRKVLEHKPNDVQTILDLANTLNMMNETEEALIWYHKLEEIAPSSPSVIYNLAYTYKKLNRLDEAMHYYHRVLSLNPNHTEAHFSYGLALLITGNLDPERWQKGWEEYEWRWKRNDQRMRSYAQPMWDGSSLSGKVIFLWSEQGLGDTFEFIRYARVAKELGAKKVIVSVQSPLRDIIALCPYIDQVMLNQEYPPYFDVHAPLLSMPYLTKVTLDNVPNEVPYLYADPALEQEWADRLADDTNFKIGICWQGNPNYSTQFLRMAVAAKSMPVTNFLPLMQMPGVSVYSLQKVSGTDQLSELPDDAPLRVFGGDFDKSKGRFMDTAAIIKQLDLVVSIDTSICHFAAGLGVPTWNLLPTPPDWRWMLDCDDTPWYENMRLFRQPTPGDWQSVMHEVMKELTAHLEGRAPLIYFKHSYKHVQ